MEDREIAHLAFGRQEGLHRYGIGHLADANEVSRDLIDATMQRLEEMGWLEEVRYPVKGIVIDQDRAQQRLFRFNIMGCFPIKRVFLIPRIVEFAYRRFRHDS